ncbi:DNRLRE domain-containing protein [Streptomyces sp. fd1-xmd]|uniref:DNRLRE domain-containing protein n=1 Tax=Streptomyces sp. fd1-xmd TaxID=1812480 RepID=UPI00099076F2|nr:DNRLRE domain-containing protein [Streptomyces sp. fd1-xmd]AQT70378.1 sugar-binding protein [Streptomyces sp. fd1-xmd]
MSVSTVYSAEAALAAPSARAATQAPKPPAPTSAADIPSARVAARLSGQRVEALSERTETSTTWANKDGSLTTDLAAGPIRFLDPATGAWRDVDVELASAADGSVHSKAHPRGLKLAGKSGTKAASLKAAQDSVATDLVTLGSGDEAITLQWRGGLPAPKLDGTRATYENAVPGADVVVEATRTGFEQFVEVKATPEAGFSYTLPLKTKGLKVEQQPDGSVLFTDKKSDKTATMPAPVMWDSTVDEVSGEHTRRAKVAMKVVKTTGGVDLVITPDAGFLADPATKYPVTVDPSTSTLGNLFDTYVQQGETVDWSNDTELDLGNPGTKNADGTFRTARSFITWNTAPVADALISSATLSLWNFHSGNTDCSAQPWEVWTANNASTASRWTNQPAMVTKMATSTQTKGNAACTADGWITADVKNLVQHWSNNKWAYSGMGLRATDENDVKEWKRVNSSNAASNPPKLTVTYNYRPRTGTKQEAGAPFFSYGGAYVVNSVTPTLRDTFIDANGDTVQGAFQIFDNATNAQVGDVLRSSFVPSGQPASVTVPAGVLANGKTYRFRTSPYDGTHYNLGWSAEKTFTVDTSAPSAPTGITSTDYPSNGWVKGAGQAGTFNVTPPATDHNWLEWSLDGVTWTKVPTGGAAGAKAISLAPPKDGTHTLQVRTVDKADNKSEPLSYAFHAGPGGFIQPAEGEHTARRMPLVAEADGAKFTSVSFSWRRSEADPWAQIPAGHVTSGGTPLTAWPVPMTGGKNAPLVWNTTDTVNPDGSVQIKADFSGPGGTGATQPLNSVVDRNADGATASAVGPGSLNMLTGDYTLSGTDVSVLDMSVTRSFSSRTPDAGATQAGQAAIFGKEWVTGTAAQAVQSDYSELRKTSATSLDVVTAEGGTVSFTANAAKTSWIPETGAENLVLTGTFTSGDFTLSDTDGAVTTFSRVDASAAAWIVSRSLVDGRANSTTEVVSEAVTVGGKILARPKRVITATSAVTVGTCETAPSTKGCRVLEFVYASATTATSMSLGDVKDQVSQIRVWATTPGAASSTATTVAAYMYDDAGRLRETWDPRISPALKTAYAYDTSGRVTEMKPPGQLPWTFHYGKVGTDPVSGEGMLLKVTRPTLKAGSASETDGNTAQTTVVYGVSLTGAKAPQAMGAADVKAWGQLDAPTDATAVFPTDSRPASNDGSALVAADYGRAMVHYLNASGREVNTLDPGKNVTTTEYDRFGNAVRELSAGNRALAIGATAEQKAQLADLGIAQIPVAERAELLSNRGIYNADGSREVETLGPLHRVILEGDLKDGTTTVAPVGDQVIARHHTVKEYDNGRPTDGSANVSEKVTKTTEGAKARNWPLLTADSRTTQTVYDWVKGQPISTIQDPGGLAITEKATYDAAGRQISRSTAGSNGTDAGTLITEYYTGGGTGVCAGRPEWADEVCRTRPAAAITGGGTNPTELVTTTAEYDRWGQTSKLTETANGSTRVKTTGYDAAGRATTVTVTGGVGTAVPAVTTTFDAASGKVATITSTDGGTIRKAYDQLGRLLSYTDADGGVTTSTYDAEGRAVQLTDSVPSTTTYSYDTAIDPRGLPTSITDSVAGTFTVAYDGDGQVRTQKLPGGYTMRQGVNPAGMPTERTYTRDSDGTVLFSETLVPTAHGQRSLYTGSAGQSSNQKYGYDKAGRLVKAEDDTVDSVCVTRTYTFDKNSNRKTLATAAAAPGLDCTTAGATTKTHTYDTGDRLVDSGYAYDAFGRTSTAPGTTLSYFANDLVRQQTVGSQRQTWSLDSQLRFRGWTVESNASGSWAKTQSKLNHYSSDADSPRWTVEDTATGALTRNVNGFDGQLAAVTAKTDSTVLQLVNLHGDVVIQLPTTAGQAPTVLKTDEYGNRSEGQPAVRYGWHGGAHRSTETLSAITLMGVRLYNPTTGRFLSADPIPGGSCNAYDYACADPINNDDVTGCATCRVPKHAWTGRSYTTVLRTTSWSYGSWHNYSYHWIWDVISGDWGPQPITAWQRQYRYRTQYIFKCRVVAWYGWGRQKILATHETHAQHSYRDRTTYRIAFTGIKWTRTGGWSWARTSWSYVSSSKIVYTKG